MCLWLPTENKLPLTIWSVQAAQRKKMMSILRLHGTHKQLLWTKCQVFALKLAVKTAFIRNERVESTSKNEILDSRKKLICGKQKLH